MNEMPSAPQALPTFPDTVWFSLHEDYLNLVGPTTEVSDSFIWAAASGALSALASRVTRMPWGPGSMLPLLNIALLGRTSRARKSTAIADALRLIAEPITFPGVGPEEPNPFSVISGTGSGEGLLEEISDREWWKPGANRKVEKPQVQTGRSALIVIDELGGYFEKIGRESAGSAVSFLLQLFDAPPRQSLKTRTRPLVATNASGSVLAASTVAYLASHLSEALVHAGLMCRFLWVEGERVDSIPVRPPVDPSALQAFTAKLQSRLVTYSGTGLWLTPAAHAAHKARYEAEFNRPAMTDLEEAAVARSDVQALRLAMLNAFSDGALQVDEQHVRAAWQVVDYSRGVALRLLGQLSIHTWKEAEGRIVAAARRSRDGNGLFSRAAVRERLHGSNGLDARAFNGGWAALLAAGDILAEPDTSLFRLAVGIGQP